MVVERISLIFWIMALFGWVGGAPDTYPIIGPDNAAQLIRLKEIHFSPWDLVMAVAWSPDGELLAVSAGETIHLLQTSQWELLSEMPTEALTHSLEFSSDGKWLASGSRDGNLRIWYVPQLSSGLTSGPDRMIQAHRKGVNAVRFNPDGTLLASGGNDAIARFWNPLDGEMISMTIGGTFAVPSIDFSPDGQVLAVVNGDVVRLREVGSERIVGTFQAGAPLYQLRFSPDGSRLAVTGSDNLIRIWEIEEAFRTGQPVFPDPLLLTGHNGDSGTFRALVWQADFSPDGRLLVSAGGDATLRFWDPNTGSLLASYLGHKGGATSLAFRPDGRLLASGGLDGGVIIWGINP